MLMTEQAKQAERVEQALVNCPGCGAEFPESRGTGHPYLGATPACYATYSDVLAREYGEWEYPAVHRLTVAAYAAQHPGRPDRRTIRSTALHLATLCALLERGMTYEQASGVLKHMAESDAEFHWLSPPKGLGAVTVMDVASAANLDQHERRVKRWAWAVWEAWKPHHVTVREWLDRHGRP